MNHDFLPVCREDMEKRGWKSVDFAYIIGDGYVDHPSFGHAIISRLLESRGYRVGIISQPDWKDPESICIYGEPRLGFLVSAGNMDSMVNHYSVSKKRRRTDAYTPGGEMGKRPDHACVVYGNLIRQKYKKTAVIMRDYYIPIPGISDGMNDKLTHAGTYGIDVSMETLGALYETSDMYFPKFISQIMLCHFTNICSIQTDTSVRHIIKTGDQIDKR